MKIKLNILILIFAIGFYGKSKAQTWDTLPGMMSGVVVHDMNIFHDTLILAGNFISGMALTNSYSVIGWDSLNLFSYPGL